METTRNPRPLIALLAVLTMAAAACGSAESGAGGMPGSVEPGDGEATTTTTAANVAEPGRGWIGGEPDWYAVGDDVATLEAAGAPASEREASGGGAEVLDAAPIPVEPDGGDGARPAPIVEPPPPSDTPLRAGSVDDNVDYQGFLDYLARIEALGIAVREFDPSGRIVVSVTGSNGLPVSGVEVVATVGESSSTLRTTADGTVRFLPAYLGVEPGQAVSFTVGGQAVSATPGSDVDVTIDRVGGGVAPIPLDILFLLDATGSMGDEIDRLKATIDTVAERVAQLDPAPDVRFAMTLYRDEGDAFVTANYDFTGDVAEFRAALSDVVADGGGDYPEALDEGLADALAKPSWRDPATAVQLIFVVADAPPQVARQVPVSYVDSIRDAAQRGIKIFPVASSESDDQAEAVFRQMAQATGAPFVFLSNGAAGASLGGSTDIQSTDYEELALDELVVRLIAEELADLNGGGDVTVPTTQPPVTTNPEGQ